jgi:hypothetical protein
LFNAYLPNELVGIDLFLADQKTLFLTTTMHHSISTNNDFPEGAEIGQDRACVVKD